MLVKQGTTAEVSEVMDDETLPALDKHRDAWAALVQYEENQMNVGKGRPRQVMPRRGNSLAFLILMAIVVAIGIAVFATRKLTMEIHETEQAKIAIRELNEELERKVAERTEELARTVEALKGEENERRAREETSAGWRRSLNIRTTRSSPSAGWNHHGLERRRGTNAWVFTKRIIGRSIATVTHPDHRDEALENQARLKRGDSVVRRESVRGKKGRKSNPHRPHRFAT